MNTLFADRVARARTLTGDPAYAAVAAACAADVLLPDDQAFNSLATMAMGHAVGLGAGQYGLRVKGLAMASFPATRGDQDFWDRLYYPFWAKALSWCSDCFTAAEAKWAAGKMLDDVFMRLPEFSGQPIWAVGLPGDGKSTPANNYYEAAMLAALVGYATLGLDDRAAKVLVAVAWRYDNEIEPVLRTQCAGGGMFESTNYGFATLARLAEVVLTLDAWDGGTRSQHPFWKQSVLWRLHATAPTLDRTVAFGDQPRSSMGYFYDTDFMSTLMAADFVGGDEAQWAKAWLSAVKGDWTTIRDHSNLDMGLLFANPSVQPADWRQAVSTYYFTPYNGYGLWRSSWSEDATLVVVQAGNDQLGHMDEAEGSVWVDKGGPLIGKAGDWAHSGQAAATEFQSVPLIDGKGQQWRVLSPSNGFASRTATKSQLQSRDAYNVNEIVCIDFSRLVQFDETSGSISDRVVPANPGMAVTEQFHAQSWAPLGGDWYESSNEKYKLRLRLAGARIDDVNLGPNGERTSQALRSDTATSAAWQIAAVGQPYPPEPQLAVEAPAPTVLPPPTTETQQPSPGPGGPPPVPATRQSSSTKVTFQNSPDGYQAVVSGLPQGISILQAKVAGTKDGQPDGYVWQKGYGPGAGAELGVSGMVLSWPKLDGDPSPGSYVATVVGSDNLEDAGVPVTAGEPAPPPPDPLQAQLDVANARIAELEAVEAGLELKNSDLTALLTEATVNYSNLSTQFDALNSACKALPTV